LRSRQSRRSSALSAGTIALEISSRNARVAALQKRWDRLRAGLDLILDQRGADMMDLSGGASGRLQGKGGDRLVTRIDPGVVSLFAELRGAPSIAFLIQFARILTKLLLIFCRQKFLGQVVLFHGSLQPQPSQTISRILSSATVSAIFLRLGSPLASDVAKWAACSRVTLGGMGGS
jgi:hypothetical protein